MLDDITLKVDEGAVSALEAQFEREVGVIDILCQLAGIIKRMTSPATDL